MQLEMLSCRVQTGRVVSAALQDPASTARSSERPSLICARDAAPVRSAGRGRRSKAGVLTAEPSPGTRPLSGNTEGAKRGGAAGAGWWLHPAPEVC